ncbi:MAG TPA: hypothetical protein VHL32_00950 [Gemmatimonadaceae bacterium]|jgi:hypothetical protein|nr:hypothetical protein [Gemmatimonadaceae bacterium]
MTRKPWLACSAALIFAVAACSDSTGPNGISADDANELAADLDATSAFTVGDIGLGAAFDIVTDGSGAAATVSSPTTFDNNFSFTHQCPKGGEVALAGRVVGTGDRATRSLSVESTATRTDTDCAFQTKHGQITLNGNPNIAFDGKLNIVNGVLSGPQTATHKGSFSWARTGASGTCDVDLTSTYDPDTHTATVTGTFCGIDVNVTRTR